MPGFTKGFGELMILLEKKRCPKPQCNHIKYYPDLNPPLDPQPQNWWRDSFDWYISVDLIPGVEYGPFYILHGDWFWPQIGNPRAIDSEKKCFFQFEESRNIAHAKELYNPLESTLKNAKFLYKFTFNVNNYCFYYRPLMFIGPVKGGTGYQMNPNRATCTAIRIAIVQEKVFRCAVIDERWFSVEWELYSAWGQA
jgi:hypothetical protein